MLSQPENLLAPDDGMTLFDPVHPMVKLNDLQDTDCRKKKQRAVSKMSCRVCETV